VATGAWRDLSRTGIHTMHCSRSDWAVALVAELVDIGNIQQPCILRPVRCVAAKATFPLHRSVFEHKWPARLRMTLGADSILIRGGPYIVVAKGAMNVVAVTALDQAFIHLVMERLCKRRLDVRVARVAERGLRCLQQIGFFSSGMNAMAASATDPGLEVR